VFERPNNRLQRTALRAAAEPERWAAPAGVLGAFRMAEEFMIRAFEQTDRQAVIDANLPPVWRAAQLSC
jgi:hypothetical protein